MFKFNYIKQYKDRKQVRRDEIECINSMNYNGIEGDCTGCNDIASRERICSICRSYYLNPDILYVVVSYSELDNIRVNGLNCYNNTNIKAYNKVNKAIENCITIGKRAIILIDGNIFLKDGNKLLFNDTDSSWELGNRIDSKYISVMGGV